MGTGFAGVAGVAGVAWAFPPQVGCFVRRTAMAIPYIFNGVFRLFVLSRAGRRQTRSGLEHLGGILSKPGILRQRIEPGGHMRAAYSASSAYIGSIFSQPGILRQHIQPAGLNFPLNFPAQKLRGEPPASNFHGEKWSLHRDDQSRADIV
jgi:hypothetical protein